MTADISSSDIVRGASHGDVVIRSDNRLLRTFIVAAGMCWSVLFVVVGIRYELQMYGDGSIFSYSVAVQDAWAFHWHNISGRLFVYIFCHLPAETYVGLTRDARGGIVIYGFLFFVAQLLGLLATFAADRSRGRIIFSYACLSTACLCPLVFGFPTEMWMAHAVFWPTLAACHHARLSIGGFAVVFGALLALVFTHEGALIFAVAILATLLLRGVRDAALLRATSAFLVVLPIWVVVKVTLPPGDYDAPVIVRAALHFFDATLLIDNFVLTLLGALAGYGIAFFVVRRWTPTRAHIYATVVVTTALAAYWMRFDNALHTDHRYYLRTVLFIATPMLGALAAVYALDADGRLTLPIPLLSRLMAALTGDITVRATAGAILLVMLVHAVETTKFITAWTDYKATVLTLAMGAASDPALGDPHFVSSNRISANLKSAILVFNDPFPFGARGSRVRAGSARG